MKAISFKNLSLYQLRKEVDWNNDKLEQALSQLQFNPCNQFGFSSIGWIALKEGLPLVYESSGQLLLTLQREEKILPSSVIQQAVDKRIAELEQRSKHCIISKSDKTKLREEAVQKLLPQAFSKFDQIKVWINKKEQLIGIDGSHAKAEIALSMLRKSIGSLPVTPLYYENQSPDSIFADWLVRGNLPANFTVTDEAEFVGSGVSAVGNTAKFINQDLTSDEIANLLKHGKIVKKIGLSWKNCLSFVLSANNGISFNKLAFVVSGDDMPDREDAMAYFDADFVFKTTMLSEIVNELRLALK